MQSKAAASLPHSKLSVRGIIRIHPDANVVAAVLHGDQLQILVFVESTHCRQHIQFVVGA